MPMSESQGCPKTLTLSSIAVELLIHESYFTFLSVVAKRGCAQIHCSRQCFNKLSFTSLKCILTFKGLCKHPQVLQVA